MPAAPAVMRSFVSTAAPRGDGSRGAWSFSSASSRTILSFASANCFWSDSNPAPAMLGSLIVSSSLWWVTNFDLGLAVGSAGIGGEGNETLGKDDGSVYGGGEESYFHAIRAYFHSKMLLAVRTWLLAPISSFCCRKTTRIFFSVMADLLVFSIWDHCTPQD